MTNEVAADRSGLGERVASGAHRAHDGGKWGRRLVNGAHDARGARLDEIAEERLQLGEVIENTVGGGATLHTRGGRSGFRARDASSGVSGRRCGDNHQSPSIAIFGEESAPPECVSQSLLAFAVRFRCG